jgi:protein-S-isoprenylcysteine O-methyltransferase Ste14
VLLASTFLINHFELFGLSQYLARLSGHDLPEPEFRTPLFLPLRAASHLPRLSVGFWAALRSRLAGYLLFRIATTGYIFVGIWPEERDLVAQFGERYRRYRRQAGMLLPYRKAQ